MYKSKGKNDNCDDIPWSENLCVHWYFPLHALKSNGKVVEDQQLEQSKNGEE